ncbi:hypothetical protein COV14_04795 [Candidatus Woesearchaeota archaeon CG10_big_fil_rev_8_21_14_0_10_33_12]|nr:MAG: hypothetical protein COV14_04795 [Candidatus Woesearchaeota archaeon CG10_big_fil_rev_8_21_14_0_10_33_12]
MDYNSRLDKINQLLKETHYDNAIEDSVKIIESLLKEIYQKVTSFLNSDEKKKIIEIEEKFYSKKSINEMGCGELVGLFSQTKLLEFLARKEKKEYLFLNIGGFQILNNINRLRIASTHYAQIPQREQAEFSYSLVKCIIQEYLTKDYKQNPLEEDDTEQDDIIPNYKNIKLNNLPRLQLYKFVGRQTYIQDIETIFSDTRNFIVSIDGIGGVGKTTLALEIARKFWDEKKYDAIVWTTAKKNRLESTGIINIVPALSTLEELLNEIIKVFSIPELLILPLDEKKYEIKKLLKKFKTLLIIDNLETIEDEKIINFVKDELPAPTHVITTTRKKLVEAGRYVMLKEFTQEETNEFIASILEEKKVEVKLSDENKVSIQKLTGGNPLALKIIISWLIEGISIDSALEKIKKGEHKILEFCFEETFSNLLSSEAKKTFVIFPIFSESVTFEEIKVATNMGYDGVNNVIFELERYTLINSELVNKDNKSFTVYSMSPVTRMFAYNKLTEYNKQENYRGLEQESRRRLAKYYNIKEKTQAAIEQYGLALEDIGGQSETGRTSALIANSAMAQYQRGSYDKALDLFKQAIKINPKLSYTYQLWAVVERQQGNNTRAEELFHQAADLNPTNPIIWFSWANMKRDEGNLSGAEKILEDGKIYAKNNVRNLAMFNQQISVLKSKQGKYTIAIETSEASLVQKPNLDERRTNTHLFGPILESYIKIISDNLDKRNYTEIIKRGLEIISKFDKHKNIIFSNNDIINWKLHRIYRYVGTAYRQTSEYSNAELMFKNALGDDYGSEEEREFNIKVQLDRALNFKFSGQHKQLKKHLKECYNIYSDHRFKEFY